VVNRKQGTRGNTGRKSFEATFISTIAGKGLSAVGDRCLEENCDGRGRWRGTVGLRKPRFRGIHDERFDR